MLPLYVTVREEHPGKTFGSATRLKVHAAMFQLNFQNCVISSAPAVPRKKNEYSLYKSEGQTFPVYVRNETFDLVCGIFNRL